MSGYGPAEVSADRPSSGVVVVRMSGDLDVNRVASLSNDFFEASGSAPSGIVVDLSEVTFCDVACLRVLANVARRADEAGTWLRLAGPSSMVRRLLQITGLDVALACFGDVESATGSAPDSHPLLRDKSI